MIATPPIVGRAALGLVALRALVADLLAEALPGEEPDQVRGEQDRDRERHARGDEDTPHATGSRVRHWSPSSASASRSRPAARDALTSTTSPGSSSRAQQRRAAVRPTSAATVAAARRTRRRADRHERRSTPSSAATAADLGVRGRGLRRPARPCRPSTAQVRRRGRRPRERGQRLQRRAHRLRVRVVGVVDHGDAVRAVGDLHPPPARRGRPPTARRRRPRAWRRTRAPPRRRPGRCRRGARRPAAAPPPPALRGDQPEPGAARRPASTSSARTSRLGDRPTVTTRAARARRHRGDGRVVGVEHRHPVGGQRLHQLALRRGDRLRRAELAQVRAPDVEHHPDPRLRDAAQRGDVARARGRTAPAPGGGWSASARSAVQGRPSSLLNDPGGATVGPSGARTAAEQVLRRGLAGAAGDPDDRQAGSLSAATLCAARRASAARTAAPEPSGSVAAR